MIQQINKYDTCQQIERQKSEDHYAEETSSKIKLPL